MTDVIEEEVVAPVVDEIVSEAQEPEFDMGMSDEDFENTNFEELEQAAEEPSEEETPAEESDVPNESDGDAEDAVEAPAVELDKAAEYDKIMAEFKANGKMVNLDSAEEARQLMKMGAGYNKKMADIKSDQRFVKMLQNNDLLNEEKLSFLIDLDKKNPEAIAKLLKDSGIDPLDVNTTENAEYKPNAYTVDDKQVQLDSVIEDLQDSSAYATTIDIVGNKWDETSRDKLAANPEDIRTINTHVESGIYEQIASVVEKERMLGKLQGVNDFDAYRMVGDAMNAQGAFNKPQANGGINIPAPAKKADPNVNDKKRAASSTKAKPRVNEQFNIQDLSDADFEKKYGSGLQ